MTRELVERAMHGDTEAFGALAQQRLSRLVGTAGLILRDADAGEDAVQEALVRAWRDLPGLRDPDRFDGWLHRIVVRRCMDYLRRRRADPDAVSAYDLGAWTDPGTGDELDLSAAIAQLSDEHRQVVVLRYYLGLTQDEVASALGVRVGTVKSRLSRALDYLRAEMAALDRAAGVAGGGT